jgi:hypothetical protein
MINSRKCHRNEDQEKLEIISAGLSIRLYYYSREKTPDSPLGVTYKSNPQRNPNDFPL